MVVRKCCEKLRATLVVMACWVLVAACSGSGGSDDRSGPQLPALVELPQQAFPQGRWNGSIGSQLGFGEGVALADGSAWFMVRDPMTSLIGVMVTRPQGGGATSVPAYGRFLDMMLDTITPVAFELDASVDPGHASGHTVYDYTYGFGKRKAFYVDRDVGNAPVLSDVVGHHAGAYLAGVERYLGVSYGSVGLTIDASGSIRGMTRRFNATCNLEGQISESTQGSTFEIRLRTLERNACPLIGLDVRGIGFTPRVGNGLLLALVDEDNGVMAGLELEAVSGHPMLPPGLFDYLP